MKRITKITALLLAFIMSASLTCMTAPVAASSGYEYNGYLNAMVVKAENNAVTLGDADAEMIAQAKAMGADAVIFNAGQSFELAVTVSDAMLSGLADSGLSVRMLLDGGKVVLNKAALAEMSDKVRVSFGSHSLTLDFDLDPKGLLCLGS